jgi:hypothetical protein
VYGIHNNHDHVDEGKRVKGDRGREKGEGGRMERGGRKGYTCIYIYFLFLGLLIEPVLNRLCIQGYMITAIFLFQ